MKTTYYGKRTGGKIHDRLDRLHETSSGSPPSPHPLSPRESFLKAHGTHGIVKPPHRHYKERFSYNNNGDFHHERGEDRYRPYQRHRAPYQPRINRGIRYPPHDTDDEPPFVKKNGFLTSRYKYVSENYVKNHQPPPVVDNFNKADSEYSRSSESPKHRRRSHSPDYRSMNGDRYRRGSGGKDYYNKYNNSPGSYGFNKKHNQIIKKYDSYRQAKKYPGKKSHSDIERERRSSHSGYEKENRRLKTEPSRPSTVWKHPTFNGIHQEEYEQEERNGEQYDDDDDEEEERKIIPKIVDCTVVLEDLSFLLRTVSFDGDTRIVDLDCFPHLKLLCSNITPKRKQIQLGYGIRSKKRKRTSSMSSLSSSSSSMFNRLTTNSTSTITALQNGNSSNKSRIPDAVQQMHERKMQVVREGLVDRSNVSSSRKREISMCSNFSEESVVFPLPVRTNHLQQANLESISPDTSAAPSPTVLGDDDPAVHNTLTEGEKKNLMETFIQDTRNISTTVKILVMKLPELEPQLMNACKEILTELSLGILPRK